MKKKIIKSITVLFLVLISISCTEEGNDPKDLNQNEKFSEFAKYFLNQNNDNIYLSSRNPLKFNPFINPDSLTPAEIDEISINTQRVYMEIKEEYISNGGREENYNNYFSDKVTDAILDEVYPVYSEPIAQTNDTKACWVAYGNALTTHMLTYSVELAGCIRWYGISGYCTGMAFTKFAQRSYAAYLAFASCIEKASQQ